MTHTFDDIEQAAWTDLFAAARAMGSQLEARPANGGVQLIAHGNNSLLFNRIIGVGGDTPQATLDSLLDAYKDSQVERFFLHLYEHDLTDALKAWLTARGIARYRRDWHKLVRGSQEPLPEARSALQVAVTAQHQRGDVERIFGQGFDLSPELARAFASPVGRPGWFSHVACLGDRVVATSLLFIAGEAAYIAGAATLPEFRGHGAQQLLLRERCRIALDQGCKVMVAETGAPHSDDPQHSYHNLLRAGFRPEAVRRNYAPDGTLWRHGSGE